MSKENLADFELAQSKILYFQKNLLQLLKSTSDEGKQEFLYQMHNPSGHGTLILGKDAYYALMNIAKRELKKNSAIIGKVGTQAVFEAIRYIFVTQIINHGKQLTQGRANKIVASAVKHVLKTKLETVTHYRPIIIPADEMVSEFSIGPVMICSTETFFTQKGPVLAEFTASVEEQWLKQAEAKGTPPPEVIEQTKQNAKMFEQDLKAYYSNFPWIAAVKVRNYEHEQSGKVAEVCFRTALCFLKLMLPPSYADDIYLGDDTQFIKSARYSEPDGKSPVVSLRGPKNLLHKQDWVTAFTTSEQTGGWLASLGSLIHVFLSGKPIPLLYQRFLNAIWWYSEAVTSPLPYIQIVALSNALEACLSTTTKDDIVAKDDSMAPGISAQIAGRVALLLKVHGQEDWAAKTKQFYSIRSDLVHGNIPAFDWSVQEQVGIGLRIVRLALAESMPWTIYCANHGGLEDLKIIHTLFEEKLPLFADGKIISLDPEEQAAESLD